MRRSEVRQTCVGTGFIVLDVVQHLGDSDVKEKRYVGGSCGNVLSVLAYLGWNAVAVGRIGRDAAGHELLSDFRKFGVKTNFLEQDEGAGTPIVVQQNYSDAKGRRRHRFSLSCPTCGARMPAYRPILTRSADVLASKLPNHSVFYFDRLAPGILELATKSAEGSLVVFEPSGIKDEKLFKDCLSVAHIVKYANDRLPGIRQLVSKAKVPIEVETFGAKGLRVSVRKNGSRVISRNFSAFPVANFKDSSGSGDWCTAGLLRSLLNGDTRIANICEDAEKVFAAARFGQALAALNCNFVGARGLMYAANAQSVLPLAISVASGSAVPSDREIQSHKAIGKKIDRSVCASCSA